MRCPPCVRGESAHPRLDTINAQHRALVAALDAVDADQALEILTAHLRPVPEVLALLPSQ